MSGVSSHTSSSVAAHSQQSAAASASSTTAAKIAALSKLHPAHPTSLGMQLLAEEKLHMRMRVQQKDGKKEVIVLAVGWILNEWLLLLESRRASHSATASGDATTGIDLPPPAFLPRLRDIAHVLLADPSPSREPIEAANVWDAGTAIPDGDLDFIIARIPNPVPPDSAILDDDYDDAEDDTLTAEQRLEEQEAMDSIRKKYEADASKGIVHTNVLTPELLAALDDMPVP